MPWEQFYLEISLSFVSEVWALFAASGVAKSPLVEQILENGGIHDLPLMHGFVLRQCWFSH